MQHVHQNKMCGASSFMKKSIDRSTIKLKRRTIIRKGIPIWPINAVSTRDAMGSAVRASAAGNAI